MARHAGGGECHEVTETRGLQVAAVRVVGFVLAASAVLKVEELVALGSAADELVPGWARAVVAVVEAAVAGALLVKPRHAVPREAALVLLLVATLALGVLAALGAPPGACHCFGRFSGALSRGHLVLNALLLTTLALSFPRSPPVPSRNDAIAHSPRRRRTPIDELPG